MKNHIMILDDVRWKTIL